MRWLAGALALSLGVPCLPPEAWADTVTPPTVVSEPKKTEQQVKAEGHYKRARELYSLGRYREAIAQLEAALRYDPEGAELLYNLGLVHEKLGEAEAAIAGYQRYLKALGRDADPEEVAKIEGAIKRLEGAKAELKARENKRLEHRLTPLSTSLLIGAGASFIGAAVFGSLALSVDREARGYVVRGFGGLEERDVLTQRAKNRALVADVLGSLALVAGGAALTLYLTSEYTADGPTKPMTKVMLRPTSVALEVTF